MHRKEMLALWQTHPRFDAQTRAQAKTIDENSEDCVARFGQELAFGTGGLRGMLGVGTNRMNLYTIARATQGLADHLKNKQKSKVAIAYDSRHFSREFAEITAGVLAHNGIGVWLYDRLMPTPMLSFAVRQLQCDAGVAITASHNPAQYNGYKVYGADGCQITGHVAAQITACIQRVQYENIVWDTPEQARCTGLLWDIPAQVYGDFITHTLACRVLQRPCEQPLRIVYTPLHGTGLEPVNDVLARMPGIQVLQVAAQCVPDGDFRTCPKPNPELPEALALALAQAEREGAALVLATDPDCDRVGVASRRPDGRFQLLSGNEVGLLILEFILSQKKAQNGLPKDAVIVKTIVTSDLAFSIASAYDATVLEVLTGFKYIGEAIAALEEKGEAERFLFGFEESCGYLAGAHVRDKDGVMACMLVAEMAQHYQSQQKTLTGVLEALYRRYGYVETRLCSYDIQGGMPMDTMHEVMKSLRSAPPEELAGQKVAKVTDYREGINGLPPSDVLCFETAEGQKAIVRPSGTEPKIKVYLSARAQSKEIAQACISAMEGQIDRRMRGAGGHGI